MHRTASEGGASTSSPAKMWRFGSALRKIGSISSSKDDKNGLHRPHADSDAQDSSLYLRSIDSHSLNETHESNYRQLQALVQRMRSAPSGPNHVDAAYKEFVKHKDSCSTLCYGILQDEIRPVRALSNATETLTCRDSSADSPRSPGAVFDQRSSFSGRSLAEVVAGGGARPPPGNELCLGAIRDWKNCLETMADAFKVSLADTYKSYERDATPEMVDLLFNSKKFRKEAVQRMRNASVTRVLSADPQFFPRYEIRFRNYEKVKQELSEIRHLLQAGESGISPSRPVEEFAISPRGDAILEFANLAAESSGIEPVLRFRVSSYMLAETSPIFARMFSGHSSSLHLHEAEDITDQLPPPPVQYTCKDGSEVKLYRMPQHEVNLLASMEILMHAAHMHNEMVPREVGFEQFVAIAECSMRYKSTSPLELVVEHRWLPQWMHKGADDMPDGLLVISYAFGARQLFTRMSKSAVLNLVDEKDLQSKPWPQKIKDKVWAVRCAKVAQVYACCAGTIQEYIRPPARDPQEEPEPVSQSDLRSNLNMPAAPPKPAATLTGPPRCPKGSHGCDAANLGWMMLIYNEMNILPQILRPAVLAHLPEAEPQPRSVAQMVDVLRRMPSPASPVHQGGVCDPSPSFRTAIADVYNSITGLTLYDISGKSHGWALSKHLMTEPQTLVTAGLKRMAVNDHAYTVAHEFPDSLRLQILGELDDIDDLHAAARTNRDFYDTFKRHELSLIRKFLRAGRIRSISQRDPTGFNDVEDKVLKTDSDMMKERGAGDGADAVTLRSEDEDGEFSISDDDGDDDDDMTSIGGASTPPVHEMPRPGHRPVSPPSYEENDSPPSRGPASPPTPPMPPTPRQTPLDVRRPSRASPAKQPEVVTAAIDEPPLTDEEARRILWPESIDPDPPVSIAVAPPGAEGLREKFRVGDPSFSEGLEEKTLVVTGEKQLRSEHDRRVGMLKKDDGRPSTSGSKSDGSAGSKSG
ncbi:Uncharacterized protein TPAR_04815 [Tolypocladium paradoxum]|uniref:F-box domain-containing protein n=1 Tax=Tolypocladium paradoxum TaxID=94208 RepID=A0A2S4KXS5_9HYPO|nr:Uncharacterized protein TPAR_04815 [Tolypocladium paradoxum]